MIYVDIKDSDIKRGAVVYERDWENPYYTILGTTTSKSDVDHVLVESKSGVIHVVLRDTILKNYVIKAKHSLKSGDVFRLGSAKTHFLYVDDDTVIRIGPNSEYGYYNSVSQQSLHGYVTEVADGNYSKIEVLRNLGDSFNVSVKKS